jgi:hypothetical protein
MTQPPSVDMAPLLELDLEGNDIESTGKTNFFATF